MRISIYYSVFDRGSTPANVNMIPFNNFMGNSCVLLTRCLFRPMINTFQQHAPITERPVTGIRLLMVGTSNQCGSSFSHDMDLGSAAGGRSIRKVRHVIRDSSVAYRATTSTPNHHLPQLHMSCHRRRPFRILKNHTCYITTVPQETKRASR